MVFSHYISMLLLLHCSKDSKRLSKAPLPPPCYLSLPFPPHESFLL
ncbi:hypothetical protein SLEP1_g51042 [Rubroshorea leprosula]|uniref:Uncharacterized protein n=1 Tax=Rubroshorea leprosula TaxID=152421 RepID=A0AAV5M1X0_9ROSI|nr:hypothetical protein SLEP1_g51042 [Rubroshorea leprosula]